MNYKITNIIGVLRWKMAMLMGFLFVTCLSVLGQGFRVEYDLNFSHNDNSKINNAYVYLSINHEDCPFMDQENSYADTYNLHFRGTADCDANAFWDMTYSICNSGCEGSSHNYIYDTSNDHFNIYGTMSVNQIMNEFQVLGTVTYYPILSGALPDPEDNTLATNDAITLNTNTSFIQSVYVWEFSVDDGITWHKFSNSYNPTISATSLLQSAELDANNYLCQNVLIRVNPCGDAFCKLHPDAVSNIVVYEIVPSSPNITASTTKPTCSSKSDGIIKITLDRALYPGETLDLNLYSSSDKLLTIHDLSNNKLSLSNLDSNKSFEITELSSDIYSLTYQSKLPECNGKPKSIYGITIPHTSAVNLTATHTNITCNGKGDGTITLSAMGGTGNGYQYSYYPYSTWTGFSNSTTPQITERPKGSYTLKVKDGNGCESAVADVEIKEPDTLTITVQNQINASKFESADGSITVAPGGGTRPYKYAWTDEKGISASTDSAATKLKAGTYTLTLTDGNYSTASPNTGCAITNSFTIKQPDELVISSVSKPNDCNGKADGKIVVTATGGAPIGAPTHTYQWYKKNNAGTFDILEGETSSSISNREGGIYKVTVTDANKNRVDKEIPLIDPDPISISGIITDVDCTGSNTGKIIVSATGGTGALTYSWADDSQVTSATRQGLVAGSYEVKTIDINGCSGTQRFIVQQPLSLPTVSFTYSKNPTTYGGNDGVLAISSSGGTGNYSYVWTKDGESFDPKSLESLYAGKYTVTITDANHCQSSPATATLTNPVPPIILNNNKTNVTCYCGNNGTITVNITRDHFTDNEIKYTYSWYKLNIQSNTYETVAKSPKSSDNSNIDLNAGTYKVVVADNYKTKDSITVNLKDSTPKINLTFDKTDISCSSSSDGFAKVTATGGNPGVLIPYTYRWDTGATTDTISHKAVKRHYKVTVTDSIGCSTTDSVFLYKPDPLTVTLTGHDPNGYGRGNGSITAEVKGGTTDYTYDWTGTDFDGTKFTSKATSVSGLKAGNYLLIVKDKNLCSATASVRIDQPNPLIVNIEEVHPVSCHDGSDGILKATASGGVKQTEGTYTYTWKKINAENTYSPISSGTSDCLSVSGSAGDYLVEVEDAYHNDLKSANTITLINPEPLAISTQRITDVNCYNDSTGQIHFTVTGGTGSYTYWNDKGESISNDLTGLHAGKHTVKIKDAYCELDHEFTVSEPSAALSLTLAKKELSAYHATDAELVGTITGGTPPYFKIWEGSNSTTETASGLASGTYKLTVTDNNGCKAEASATFIDPLKVDIVVKHSIDCYGEKGELAARAVGGEPSLTGLLYKYTWYQVKDGVSTLLYPDDSNDSLATDLPEGYYSVEIDDRHNRTLRTDSFHLTQPEMLQISVDSTNVTCKGDNNGSIRVTASGGNGEYTYLWKDGSTQKERTNLPPGKYTVSVQDSKGCQPNPASRTISITEPEKQLTLSLQKRDVLVACDGMIEAIGDGGTRPYRFRWNDGEETVDSVKTLLCDGNYKLEVIDKNGCTATAGILLPPPLVVKISVQDSVKCFGDNNGSLVVYAQGGVPFKTGKPYKYNWKKQNTSGIYEGLNDTTGSNLRGLTAGWYALNITDSIGVTLRADSVFYLPQPEALAIRIQKTDVLCHGASTGAISAVVTGGLKPYRLLWNTGSTDAELQDIKAGVYTINATDRNGCTKQYKDTIKQPDSLTIGFTNIIAPTTSTACDGSLTASVSGGVRPYTYQWSDTNAKTATADHLCYGTFYTVTVTDSVGCSAQVTKTSKFAPPPFVVSLSVQDSIRCHGAAEGAIVAKVSGGIPFTAGKPYTYIWNKKNSTGEYRSMNINDSIIEGITSGWYAFNVQDAEFNTSAEPVYLYLPEPDALALTVSQKNITCNGLHNGKATVSVVGGVPPYTYKWSNGEISPAIDNLAPGDYSIEVTDKHGCISRQSITITEPGLLSVSFQPKLISEHNVCNGSLKTVVSGGTAPFSYAWSGVNSTVDAVSSLCAGEYSVTVTDAHGCSANQKTTFSNPPALRLSLVVQDSIKCNGNVQGVLIATAKGGIPFASGKKYRYTWKKKNSRGVFETMPAYTDSMATDLATGTYACNITDANGISLHQDSVILLPEPTELQLTIQQTNIGCSGADEGIATVIPSGGSLPYSYAWSTGDKTATVRNLSAGQYIVRVTDRNGCVAARQIYISKAAPLYLFLYKKQPLCYQSCDGTIKTTVSGGISPYSFQWTGSASTGSEAGSLCAGKYTLLVTDAAGCTIQKNDSLQNPAQLAIDLGADRYICSGQTIRYNITIPAKTGISYSWAGPDGFTATTATVDLTKPGTYTASVTDAAGCSNSGTVTLTPSGTTVANEFALPTQAFVNEKIVIVNTTYPAPDSIRWVLPAKAQILSSGQSYTEFQVADTGVYVIKMISYKGVCSSELEKEMIVSTRSQLSDIGNAKTPFIQAFSATPNPSHGTFAAKVVLQDKAEVQLKLINILSNQTAYQIRKTGDSVYEIPINISVLKGTYLLLLETPKGSSTMKVIIF